MLKKTGFINNGLHSGGSGKKCCASLFLLPYLNCVSGGVDFDEARRLGIKVIWALSLPGKVAADTAGDIICSTILNIIDEMEASG